MSNAELDRMEGWLAGIMAGLSPSARARATRNMQPILRGGQAKRIAAQRNPDGSAFAARKSQKGQKPSNKTLKFLYPAGGSGAPRVVLLKSWVKQGALLSGYDREAEGLRSFQKSKIIKWLAPTPEEQNKGARPLRQRATIKSRLMFRKLRTSRLLRTGSSPSEVWVGFTGRAADVAEVHQRGGIDRAGPKSPRVRYAQRQLLGLTAGEESQILDLLVGTFGAR